MAGTIIVGVILALMFLVAFSEWFFHLASGVNELIPSGLGFYSSLIKLVVLGTLAIGIVFWSLAMIYECPKGRKREGLFSLMDCTVYWVIREKVTGEEALIFQDPLDPDSELYY